MEQGRGREWPEEGYRACLEGERRAYAWVVSAYGGRSEEEAWAAALEWYPYEPPGTRNRGLVFHDEAWHWAMLELKGRYYWADHPELLTPPAEYRALEFTTDFPFPVSFVPHWLVADDPAWRKHIGGPADGGAAD
ncbi:hypothetical protein [Nocardiopsis suaedae]|uniref:hypothetical protein n=1 Tax=Nocardiopsis suaedae TaxID=3018444 RepID=UPI0038CD689B